MTILEKTTPIIGISWLLSGTIASLLGQDVNIDESEIFALSPFEVQAAETGGYGVSTSTTATRMNTALRDIPSTISVVTHDFLEDIAAVDFDDAITYMPAITPRQNVVSGAKIRGLRTTRNYQNNFRVSPYVSDMARFSRIEVIKGPSSAITGRGEPGGVINYITKKPLKRKSTTYQFRTGIDDFYRASIDTTGPVSDHEQNNLYYRVIAVAQSNDLWRDFESQERMGLYPSLYWEMNEKTNFLVEAELYEGTSSATVGTQFLNPLSNQSPTLTEDSLRDAGFEPFTFVPDDFQMAEPGATDRTEKVASTVATFNHSINDVVSFKQSVLAFQKTADAPYRVPYGGRTLIADQAFIDSEAIPEGGVDLGDVIIRRSARTDGLDHDRSYAAQGDLLFDYAFDSGVKSNNLTLLSYEFTDSSSSSFLRRASLQPINLNNPIYGGFPFNGFVSSNSNSEGKTNAYFLTHQSSILDDRVIAVYGYRYDDAESILNNLRNNSISETDPAHTTAGRWGLTVKPLKSLSVYYVNSDQADPEQTRFRFTGLPPEDTRSNELITFGRTGKLDEWGVKSDLLEGRVTITASSFRIRQAGFLRGDNQAGIMPDGTPFNFTENFLVTGSVFDGWEFEIFGNPIERLSIYGGYSDIETQTLAAGAADVFLENRGVPEYKTSFFAKYDFSNEGKGYYIKSGFQVLGPQMVDNLNSYRYGSSHRIDFGGGYKWKNYNFDLQFNNITNEVNPTAFIASGSNTVGPPFRWFATFTAKY